MARRTKAEADQSAAPEQSTEPEQDTAGTPLAEDSSDTQSVEEAKPADAKPADSKSSRRAKTQDSASASTAKFSTDSAKQFSEALSRRYGYSG